MQFDLRERRGIALKSVLVHKSLPKSVTLQVNARVDEIAILHTCAFPSEANEIVGAYEIGFADGTTQRVPLKYGVNIRAIDDLSPTTEAARGAAGTRVCRIRVDHPASEIHSITFSTEHPYAAPMLLAITCLKDAEGK